ncbi:MAG: aminopeptidase P family protein [Proteobacteria bacterium]|nr:aminopeptidase P family protein [Pseudomonadota bacterium]
MRGYRKCRVQDALARNDLAGIVLFNPINIRYVSDARNMQVYSLHNPCRYLFLACDGHTVLFDFRNCEHLSRHLETIDEIRPAKAWYHMAAGPNWQDAAKRWAEEIALLVRRSGQNNRRLAFDVLDPGGAAALEAAGIEPVPGLELMGLARAIKSPEEIKAMCDAIRACETGLRRMQAAHRPGITEQSLWSILNQANAELGGEWIETRLLTAGERTNPWYGECGEHAIREGDLVSFDTDLVGRHGYAVDVSRSWLTGDGRATDEQKRLYAMAYAQIHHNLSVLKPGLSFREVAEVSYKLPQSFVPQMNRAIAHGIGLCNEYPLIINQEFFAGAYDGTIEEGMVLCVESYVGEPGGREGVKLEEQVLITASGAVKLSGFPFEERLL